MRSFILRGGSDRPMFPVSGQALRAIGVGGRGKRPKGMYRHKSEQKGSRNKGHNFGGHNTYFPSPFFLSDFFMASARPVSQGTQSLTSRLPAAGWSVHACGDYSSASGNTSESLRHASCLTQPVTTGMRHNPYPQKTSVSASRHAG